MNEKRVIRSLLRLSFVISAFFVGVLGFGFTTMAADDTDGKKDAEDTGYMVVEPDEPTIHEGGTLNVEDAYYNTSSDSPGWRYKLCKKMQMVALKNGVLLMVLLSISDFSWAVNMLLKGKFTQHKIFQYKINKNLPYVAAVLLFVQILVVECFHSMRMYVVDTPTFDKINIISTVGYVVIAIIMLIVLYADRINNSLNDLYEIEKKMGKMKEQHYRLLLQKEEETRSYRHNMMNHFICLNQLVVDGDLDAAKSYLNQLIGGLKSIQEKNIVVGNSMAEILLNYYVSLLPKEVSVDVIGLVPEKIGIEDAQLSIIMGNIFSNATDELMRLQKGILRVEFKDGNKFFCMRVVNSVGKKKYVDENQRVATSKHDKNNHGFGIKSTQEIISPIGGKMELACTHEEFITTIYLKK